MSIQERRALVSLISGLVIFAVYSAYMFQRLPSGEAYSPDVFHYWGSFILILIPVSIVARIIIYILFSIINKIVTNEDEPWITDERDKLIEMKAARNSLYVFMVGLLLAMASLVAYWPPTAMFIILLFAGMMSEVIGDLSQFFFYRRSTLR